MTKQGYHSHDDDYWHCGSLFARLWIRYCLYQLSPCTRKYRHDSSVSSTVLFGMNL